MKANSKRAAGKLRPIVRTFFVLHYGVDLLNKMAKNRDPKIQLIFSDLSCHCNGAGWFMPTEGGNCVTCECVFKNLKKYANVYSGHVSGLVILRGMRRICWREYGGGGGGVQAWVDEG